MKVLNRKQIILDKKFYPREEVNWMTAYRYAQSMKAGNKFPPMVVGRFEDKYFLIDGWHRFDAYRQNKQNDMTCLIRAYDNERDMYLDAVKLNAEHGKQFSHQDIAGIVLRLKEYRIDKATISKLVGVTMNNIEPYVAKRLAYTSSGKEVILKSSMTNLAGKTVPADFDDRQESAHSRDAISLVNELISIIENKAFDMRDKALRNRIGRLKYLLRKI